MVCLKMRPFAFRSSVLAIALVGMASAAEPGEEKGKTPARDAPVPQACSNGARGAIFETACEVSRGLGRLDAPIMVVAGPPTGDGSVSKPDELATRVAETLAALAGATLPSPRGALSLSEARHRASAARTLVFATIDVSNGRIRIAANAYPGVLGFWDRVRGAVSGTQSHADSERRLDGEVGSFLRPVPLVSSHIEKATVTADVVAVGCGDLDGDAVIDIIVVGRRRIEKGRITAGRFESNADASWTALSPVAASPLREPIGSVVVSPRQHVDIGLTDRRTGVRLGPALALLGSFDQPIPWSGVGCLTRAGLGLGSPVPCMVGEAAAISVGAASDVDAVAGARVVSADGHAHTVVAWRERATSTAVLLDDTGRSARLPGVGGQIAVGDLDFDGVPELVFGADTRNAAADVLAVRSWGKDGQLRERLRLPVPDGIKAVSVCPADGARAASMVVATGKGLWIVR